jgi:hypothetical protein
VTVIAKGTREPAPVSPNCASCGDVLNERYERVEIVDGQRHHGLCADRLAAIKAPAPIATKPDPYAAHREQEQAREEQERNRFFFCYSMPIPKEPAKFTADTVPSEYLEKFGAHPWEAEDVDDV